MLGYLLEVLVSWEAIHHSIISSKMTFWNSGKCLTPTQLLICSSFSRENGHLLLICSSLSTSQNFPECVSQNLGHSKISRISFKLIISPMKFLCHSTCKSHRFEPSFILAVCGLVTAPPAFLSAPTKLISMTMEFPALLSSQNHLFFSLERWSLQRCILKKQTWKNLQYGWWKKSCTSCYGKYPIYRVYTSQVVVWDFWTINSMVNKNHLTFGKKIIPKEPTNHSCGQPPPKKKHRKKHQQFQHDKFSTITNDLLYLWSIISMTWSLAMTFTVAAFPGGDKCWRLEIISGDR